VLRHTRAADGGVRQQDVVAARSWNRTQDALMRLLVFVLTAICPLAATSSRSAPISDSDESRRRDGPQAGVISDAGARSYRTRISDTLDGARSVRRDVDGDPSE
jgi:hypothetical protein